MILRRQTRRNTHARGRCRPALWLAVLALLVNLAGHTMNSVALAAVVAERPGGLVIVICSPDGFKKMLWTPEGFVPLPGEEGQTKQSCPYCTLGASGAVVPEAPNWALPLRQVESVALQRIQALLRVLPGTPTPPARAPPRLA